MDQGSRRRLRAANTPRSAALRRVVLLACKLNPKQISVYIGHSDVKTTCNIYGHLMPGDEEQAAKQLDAFLGRAQEG